MVQLEILPEPLAQVVGQSPEAVVVQSGLAFAQVVHEQVADGPASELVSVDQLAGGLLASGAQLPQPGWSPVTEDPQFVQYLVEQRAVTWPSREHAGLDVQQFQDVADNDVGQGAALGSDDHGASLQGPQPRSRGDTGVLIALRHQPREPVRITGSAKVAAEGSFNCRGGHEPAQRGTGEISADRHLQRRRQLRRQPLRPPAVAVQPAHRHLPPAGPGGLSAAGQPAFLPAAGQAGPQASPAAGSVRGLAFPRCRRSPGRRAGWSSAPRLSSRPRRVAGQPIAAGRAGKRARADSRCVFGPGGPTAGSAAAMMVTMSRSRTGRPGSRAGSRGPEPAGRVQRPAGSVRRGGPGPAGSRPPCAG